MKGCNRNLAASFLTHNITFLTVDDEFHSDYPYFCSEVAEFNKGVALVCQFMYSCCGWLAVVLILPIAILACKEINLRLYLCVCVGVCIYSSVMSLHKLQRVIKSTEVTRKQSAIPVSIFANVKHEKRVRVRVRVLCSVSKDGMWCSLLPNDHAICSITAINIVVIEQID